MADILDAEDTGIVIPMPLPGEIKPKVHAELVAEPALDIIDCPDERVDKIRVLEPYDQHENMDAGHARARKFLRLMDQGKTAREAARACGETLTAMVTEPQVQALLQKYEWAGEKRRRVLRARMNKVLVEGSDRDACTAAKVVGDDPEIGFGGSKGDGVNVQIGFWSDATQKFLEQHENEKS